jgi:hypothetical protein
MAHVKRMLLAVWAVSLPMLLAACGSPSSAAVDRSHSPGVGEALIVSSTALAPSTQSVEVAGITVTASWSGSSPGASLEVALDTHSGDLDAVNLAGAVLRNDHGEKLIAQSWSAPPGGHHRGGNLAFAGDPTALLADAKWIELILPSLREAPGPTLRWPIVANPGP